MSGEKTIINLFEAWFYLRKPDLDHNSWQSNIASSPNPFGKSSAHVDIDTAEHIARITLWDTGECVLEIMNVISGEALLSSSTVLANESDLSTTLNDFCNHLLRLEPE